MRSRAVAVAVMTVMLSTTELVRATALDAQMPSLTARQVLDRIKAKIGVPWMDQTVDTFKDDHWHDRHPDGIHAGMTRALGWQRFQRSDNEHLFTCRRRRSTSSP